jgi:hypothetical protein
MLALTATEVAALTGLDERAIRKDLEHGIVEAGSPPRFSEVALVYFRPVFRQPEPFLGTRR